MKAKEKLLIEIGERLFRQRQLAGLTQENLAERAGLSVKTVISAEKGQKALRPENIIKLCDSLSISTDYLLCGRSTKLTALSEYDEIKRLSPKQKEALSKIIEDFLSAFED